MSLGVIDLSLTEPPEGWSLEQYDKHINRLIGMYKGVYLEPLKDARLEGGRFKLAEPEKFTLADKLHDMIWVFRDARIAKFPEAKDNWLLLEGKF